jgi:signal transduction histidine kinase
MNRSEPKLDLRNNTEFDPPKLPIPWSDRLLNPIYAMLAIFNLKLPRTEPGQLYQRVRLSQVSMPPVILAVVISYQLFVVRLEMWTGAFWAEMLFYGILGPLVTFFVIGFIGVEVREREKAESDLRDLYLELSESHRRLAAIQRVTRNVSEAADLGAVLETAIHGIVEAVGGRVGVIALESGVVRTVGLGEREVPAESLEFNTLRGSRRTLDQANDSGGTRLRLPLEWSDRFLGLVSVEFAGHPRAESRELLEILVAELAAAIEAAEHRTRDLLTVFEVDRSIRAESNLERLLEAVVGRIRERVNAEASGVYLMDEDGQLRLTWGWNAHGNAVKTGFERGFSFEQLASRVLEERVAIVTDGLEASDVADDPLLVGVRSAIGLPMLADGELVGVIVLGDTTGGAFSPAERPLLSLLANQVTLAVRNARAYLYSEELAILDERNRIAREIHDGIAQTLAFTALKLDLAERLLGKSLDPETVKRVRGELETARETLREQIREVRRSIFALRPINLERLGFLETMRQFIKDFGEQNRISTTLEINGEPHLSPTNEAVMFRILQESLNNVAKHSRAKNVNVDLRTADDGVHLEVHDDGVGFDPSSLTGKVSSVGGLGLSQMRERLEGRGGRFKFSSTPGGGTQISAQVA